MHLIRGAYDERMPIVLTDFMNRADVRVVQCRGSLGVALEAAQSLLVLPYIVGQEFESDKATEVGILGLVDNAHPPAAELFVARAQRLYRHHWREQKWTA